MPCGSGAVEDSGKGAAHTSRRRSSSSNRTGEPDYASQRPMSLSPYSGGFPVAGPSRAPCRDITFCG